MNSKLLRIGVIGMGAIAPSHLFAINRAKGAGLGALCSRPDAVSALSVEHKVPCFSDVPTLLERADLDAVTVCTPSGLHLDPVLAAIEAGKHVLVEKPMEIAVHRVDRMVASARRQGVVLAGVFQSRFRPVVRRLHSLVTDGLLGEIYSGSAYIKRYRTQQYYDSGGWRGTWAVDGGGCLMNQGIHEVDLLTWFMGDAEEVVGSVVTQGRDVEVETMAHALVTFSSGARGVIEATTLAYPELPQYLEIYGARGTVAFSNSRIMRLDIEDPTVAEAAARDELFEMRQRLEDREAFQTNRLVPGAPVGSLDMGHTPVYEDFVEAIHRGREPLVDGLEARRSLALINAVYESSRCGSVPVCLDG